MPTLKPQPVNAENVIEFANELTATAGVLRALAETIREQKLPTLMVPCHDQMLRAIEYANNFAGALKKAMILARNERGDFSVPEGPKKKGSK